LFILLRFNFQCQKQFQIAIKLYNKSDIRIVLFGSSISLTVRQRGRGIYSVKMWGGSSSVLVMLATILMSAANYCKLCLAKIVALYALYAFNKIFWQFPHTRNRDLNWQLVVALFFSNKNTYPTWVELF
jgi:hypothetical protein